MILGCSALGVVDGDLINTGVAGKRLSASSDSFRASSLVSCFLAVSDNA